MGGVIVVPAALKQDRAVFENVATTAVQRGGADLLDKRAGLLVPPTGHLVMQECGDGSWNPCAYGGRDIGG